MHNQSLNQTIYTQAVHRQIIEDVELESMADLIKSQLPQRSFQKSLQMMYAFMVRGKKPQKVFCDYVPPLLYVPQAPKNYIYTPPLCRKQIIKNYQKQDLIRDNFKQEGQRRKYLIRRTIAKTFVMNGRNFELARHEVRKSELGKKGGVQLSEEMYMRGFEDVFGESWRQVQLFIKDVCNIKIKQVDNVGLERVVILLLDESKAKQYFPIFMKFIRYTYALSKITLQQIQTLNFYLQVLSLLYNKRVTVEGLQMLYQATQRNKQGQQQIVLSQAIDKVVVDASRYPKGRLPQLPKIDNKQINKICMLAQAADLRNNLIEYVKAQNTQEDDLFLLIAMIKQVIEMTNTQIQ